MTQGIYPRTERHREISRENGRKSAKITGRKRKVMSSKISLALTGHVVSKETREKIKKANTLPIDEKIKKWENKSIGYLHKLLTLKNGKPTECEGDYHRVHSTRLNWALKKGRKYSPFREDYLVLCQKCHYQYDIAEVWRNYKNNKNKQNVA